MQSSREPARSPAWEEITVHRFTTLTSSILLVAFALGCSAAGGDTGGTAAAAGSAGNSGAGNNGGSANSGGFGNVGNSGNGGTGLIGLGDGGSTDCAAALPVTYRDFKGYNETGGHIDFEISAQNIIGPDNMVYKGWNDVGCELVNRQLGPDQKPVFYSGPADAGTTGLMIRPGVGRQQRKYTGPGCWPSTSGVCYIGTCASWEFNPPASEISSATTFNQWYNTTPNVNMEVESTLALAETAAGSGVFVYDSNAFFPLDGLGFGNTPGQAHNFHFTTEIHVTFRYEAGQRFTFRGDDDLWIFVNGKLALDLGSLHGPEQGTIDFDAQAATLGITPGQTYAMDIFHAERHTDGSNFRVTTNISCFTDVVVR
jgi:fibro-slime domain-containing protein